MLSSFLDIVKITSLRKGKGMKNITIYRDSHSQDSTTISNHIISNRDLSYQARFLLIWLLSYDFNEMTRFNIDTIANMTGMPVSRTRIVVDELQNAGHIRLSRIREGCRYGCYHWHIFEQPEE